MVKPRVRLAFLTYWYLPPRGLSFRLPEVDMLMKTNDPQGGPAVASPPRDKRSISCIDFKKPSLGLCMHAFPLKKYWVSSK